ncbi:MAG: glycosyltransferase [Cyanobacteria bacterium J06626_18]
MQRLLFLAERFPPDIGGVARSAGRTVDSLMRLGLSVDVLVWSRYLTPGEVQIERDRPAPVYRVGQYRHWDMSMLNTLNVLEWLHQTHSYDAVWGHYLFPAGFLAVWFAEQQGLPNIVSARGNDVDRAMFPPGDFARLQWTLQHAGVITTVSRDLAQKVRLLSDRTDIHVLPNAVDTDCFQPATAADQGTLQALRQQHGIAPNEVVLGFSGELREKKGQQFLLPTLTTVRQHHPACLLIIGEIRTSQEALLQTYGVQFPADVQRVIVTGHLDDPEQVAQHLQLCDLLLLPSLWEGMPNALLEAMACGLGCIASDAGGIPEVLEHGKTGFLLPRFKLHHLGEAVLEWLSLDADTKHAIQQAARDRVLAQFSLTEEGRSLTPILRLLGK